MKTLTVAVLISSSIIAGYVMGYRTGVLDERIVSDARMETADRLIARYESKEVWDHAQVISKLTGASLYQVVTGLKTRVNG